MATEVTPKDTAQVFVIWYKGKRVLRTIVAVGIPAFLAFALVLPQIIDAAGLPVDSELYIQLVAFAAILTAVAGGITRIMAIPAVNAFLTKFLGLGSVPKDEVEKVAVLDTVPTQLQANTALAEVAVLPRDEQVAAFQSALEAKGLDPAVGLDGTEPNAGV